MKNTAHRTITIKQFAKEAYKLQYRQCDILQMLDGRNLYLSKYTLLKWIRTEKWKRKPKDTITAREKCRVLEAFVIDDKENAFPIPKSEQLGNPSNNLGAGLDASRDTMDKIIENVDGKPPRESAGEEGRSCNTPESEAVRTAKYTIKMLKKQARFFEIRIADMRKKLKNNPAAEEIINIVDTKIDKDEQDKSGVMDKDTETTKIVTLKEKRYEKQAVRLKKHIDTAQDALTKVLNAIAVANEKLAKIEDMEAKRAAGTGEESPIGLIVALNATPEGVED